MKKYVSHKTVEAVKIIDVVSAIDRIGMSLNDGSMVFNGADGNQYKTGQNYSRKFRPIDGKQASDDLGYYIRYVDGYESWSPSPQFESGYIAEGEITPVTPVAGYTAQPQWKLDTVNAFKQDEERLLRAIESWQRDPENADPRWLAIARTQIEQGFMALNRAIFKPERVKL